MASSINPNNIDITYPIAGQDNDSQGFRDNFTNIKSNFSYSKSEIEDLQNKVILKSALSGGSLDNDFAGALVVSPKFTDPRETRVPLGTVGGTVDIDISDGPYQTFTTSGSVALTFSNFPSAGNHSKVRIQATISNVSHTLTLPSAVGNSVSIDSTKGIIGWSSNVITFPETGTYEFEFNTSDGGSTISIQDLTRPRYNVRFPSEDLADAAAASLTTTTSYFATAAAETATLADGVDGQIKVFVMTGHGGDMDITVASAGWISADGTGYIHFTAKGQSCTLQFVAGAWYVIGNNGCTIDGTP